MKIRVCPKSRKSKRDRVPSVNTTNPLHLSLELGEVFNNENEEEVHFEIRPAKSKIQEIISPYLNLVPDYLCNKFPIPLKDLVLTKIMKPKSESIFWKPNIQT